MWASHISFSLISWFYISASACSIDRQLDRLVPGPGTYAFPIQSNPIACWLLHLAKWPFMYLFILPARSTAKYRPLDPLWVRTGGGDPATTTARPRELIFFFFFFLIRSHRHRHRDPPISHTTTTAATTRPRVIESTEASSGNPISATPGSDSSILLSCVCVCVRACIR